MNNVDLDEMIVVDILGEKIGICETYYCEDDFPTTCFQNFIQNENIYKFLPDFPKSFNPINELDVDFDKGLVSLTEFNAEFFKTSTIYEGHFKLKPHGVE